MLSFPISEPNFHDQYYRMFGKTCKSVTLITNHTCSLDCLYCYEHHKDKCLMPIEIGKKIVDFLFEQDAQNSHYINSDNANGLILDFIGGEPLLAIKVIDQIMDYFLYIAIDKNHRWATNYMISISSNGVDYFKPDVIAFMNKWYGRVHIGITIDGNQELHDSCRKFPDGSPSYHLAAAAFKDAKNRFNQHGTKLTISKENLKFLSAACMDMIDTFDLQYLQGNPVFEAEWDNQDANLYYRELKKLADWLIESGRWSTTWLAFFSDFIGHRLSEDDNQNFCGGSGKMLAFDVDGTIYPCLRYSPISVGNDMAQQFVIGNLTDGIAQNPQTERFMSCLECITRRSMSTDECWSCPIASGCATCTAWQFEHYGDGNHRCTNICPMHKARVMATSYFYNTIYRNEGESKRFAFNLPAEWAIPIVGEEEYQMLLSLASAD